MAIKQGTDELALVRKLGDATEAYKIMWITKLERETERDSDQGGDNRRHCYIRRDVRVNCNYHVLYGR